MNYFTLISKSRPGLILVASLLIPLSAVGQMVDATSLTNKTIVGYQGWFMAPGDGNPASVGWRHWSRDTTDIGPGLYTVEMWPDLSEYDADELFDAPNVTLLDQSVGKLFSSVTPKTVSRHFEWMKEYGIDGAFLQRFVGVLSDPRFFDIRNTLLQNVQTAANTHGRVFALEYDTSGVSAANMFQAITADWKFLVDTYDITNDPRYLHHNGKPIVEIWGMGFSGRGHTPAMAAQIIDFFHNDPTYGGNYLIGGVPTFWRTLTSDSETDPGWAQVYRSWDSISPWMVGRFHDTAGVNYFKNEVWADDLAETQSLSIGYLPVVWPGFSWDNLRQLSPGTSLIPRRGGEFFWEQVFAFQDLGADMMFVAMFDEVDEATAIFKVSDNHPNTDNWITLEGYPSDWYLQLAGAANSMLKGTIPLNSSIPITPEQGKITSTLLPGFVQEGDLVTLSAPATSSPSPGYIWTRNGTVISGATDADLVFAPVMMADEGVYRVQYDNGASKVVVISQPFKLEVLPAGSLSVGYTAPIVLVLLLSACFIRRLVR